MRKGILLTLLALMLLFPLGAEVEYWTGLNLLYDMNILAKENRSYFSGYSTEGSTVTQVNSLGLSWDNYIVPYKLGKHNVGPALKLHLLMPVGNGDESYTSLQGEFRADAYLGAQYIYMLKSRFGFMAGAGMEFSIYRIADSNPVNDKSVDVSISWVPEWSVGANLGVIGKSDRRYFELSGTFLYTLFHKKGEGYRILMKIGGGYTF